MHRVGIRSERNRIEQRAEAEADVRVPRDAVAVAHPQDKMAGRASAGGRVSAPHPSEHRLDGQSLVLERRREQQVVLEAIAAAPGGDHLALEVLRLERDG